MKKKTSEFRLIHVHGMYVKKVGKTSCMYHMIVNCIPVVH